MVRPDASAVASSTDDTLAPTPAPAAAPHTRNTYRNDVRHSAEVDLMEGKKTELNVSSCGTNYHHQVIAHLTEADANKALTGSRNAACA